MKKYDDYKKDKTKNDLSPEELKKVEWTKYKIIVPSEEDKDSLMDAFKHFHDAEIDTNFVPVNQLAHEYLEGYSIIVDKELFEKLNKQ